MTSRRKDMWKLLYNLMNRNEKSLEEVFSLVQEILCEEASLIQMYPVNDGNNLFQQTFVLWIINKFVKCLKGEKCNYDIHWKNITLQQKILESCLINQSQLFEQLVAAYVDAIEQIARKLSEMDYDDDDDDDEMKDEPTLHFQIFASDALHCLRDIDENCTFQVIDVQLDEVDELVQNLLTVLRHGLSIGYGINADAFQTSLPTILRALRECNITTKLRCLRYCHAVLQSDAAIASKPSAIMLHCSVLTLRACVLMWESSPIWMHAGCFNKENLNDLSSITIDILNLATVLGQECFDLCCQLLSYVTEPCRRQHSNNKLLLTTIGNFLMQQMLNEDISRIMPDMAQKQLLLRFAEFYAPILRVLVVSATANSDSFIADHLQQLLHKTLAQYNELKNVSELNFISELLIAINYLEHQHCQQMQLNFLRQADCSLTTFQQQNFRLELSAFKPQTDFNMLVTEFLDLPTAETAKVELSRVVGLILQSISLRQSLKAQTLRRLIGYLYALVKNFLFNGERRDIQKYELCQNALQLLCGIVFELPSSAGTQMQHIFTEIGNALFSRPSDANEDETIKDLRQQLCTYLPTLYAVGYFKREQLVNEFLTLTGAAVTDSRVLLSILRVLYCTNDAGYSALYKLSPYSDQNFIFLCSKCDEKSSARTPAELAVYLKQQTAICLPYSKILSKQHHNTQLPQLTSALYRTLCVGLVKTAECAFVIKHFDLVSIGVNDYMKALTKESLPVTSININNLIQLLIIFADTDRSDENSDSFLKQLAQFMHKRTCETLKCPSASPTSTSQLAEQRHMLRLISSCATMYPGISEQWLFHFFKMIFYYLVHFQSLVAQEAVLCATEICAKHGLLPINLWNWYKRDALNLIVQLAVHAYLCKGIRLTRSLRDFTKMLGFSCVQEFICQYHRLITTMILPYCIKEPRCKGIIVLISEVTRKPVTKLFLVSFLRIYTHIYLTEESNIGNRCIELIVKCTGSSFNKLMTTDVKQTVSEILVYFNRNPTFVMKSFECLLMQQQHDEEPATVERCKGSRKSLEISQKFSKFIADRFLGVITHFEICLAEANFEKPLKEEALYSLGQIIRFVGPQHVTQFRFKIIAMLSFVLTLNDRHLQHICLKIWNIFLHIVNIQELGPSLSRIVASLQPLLMRNNVAEVNAIYEFVLLRNASMLGAYISDLYFIEHMPNVDAGIRQCVARQTDALKGNKSSVFEKLSFFHKQITNENLQVRIYGLEHLGAFIAQQREEINRMLLEEIKVDTLIERIMNTLIDSCQHEDRNLQLSAAKCLGILGAVDASYMSTNYDFEQQQLAELSLSILTSDFAKMALTELCRAYQFQKNTKYVDSFSLAIQETLAVCGVSPHKRKKLSVWQALPARMHQIMEPLLTSCYTGSRRESKCSAHPIFGSHYCNTYNDWAFIWASRLIDCVKSTETKHLLVSYKPSIKRDNNTLATFLPYILLHALQECTDEQTTFIYEEILTVFDYCSNHNDEQSTAKIDTTKQQQQENNTTSLKEFKSKKYSANTASTSAQTTGRTGQIDNMAQLTRNATKLCSEQLDFLQRWSRKWQRNHQNSATNAASTSASKKPKSSATDSNFQRINDFLERFDKLLVARANYYAGECARALMYLEAYIDVERRERMVEQFSFLIQIYGKLLDADSVEGAVHVRKYDLNISQELLVNRLIDRQQDTITCYEQLMSSGDEQLQQEHIKGMISSYLRMDTPKTALLITEGLWQRLTDQYTDDYFKECKSELLWRLGSYDELEQLLDDPTVRRRMPTSWNIQCAEACLQFRRTENTPEMFVTHLDDIRVNVLSRMRTCTAIKQNSYAHSYDEVIKLHLLHEMERNKVLLFKICQILQNASTVTLPTSTDECLQELRNFFIDWNARLEILQPSVRVFEPIFGFRRNLLSETKRLMAQARNENSLVDVPLFKQLNAMIDDEIGRLWICSAQINCAADNLQRAQLSIMKAAEYQPQTLFLEKAKLLWKKGDQAISLKLLEENIEAIESQCKDRNIGALESKERAIYAEAKYLQATYNAESMNICSELNVRYFKEAICANKQSEKCYVQLAQYLEKIYESLPPAQQQDGDDASRKIQIDIMLYYARSLRCGSANIYQSLPRLISLWLDTTSRCFVALSEEPQKGQTTPRTTQMQELSRKMNDIMNNCSTALPTAIFYTVFSQLLSRICHPSGNVFNVLRTIIVNLVEHFPQQSLWMLLPFIKSSFTNRIKRCQLILTDARLAKPQFQKLLTDFNMLAERLIELTNKNVAFDRTYELSSLVRQLPKLFELQNFSDILLPFEKYMQACFHISTEATSFLTQPISSQDAASKATLSTNPFPYKQIYICGINEEVAVLRSAAKPKKITIRCSDGQQYNVMVKPKDDLRKDSRLMEFNALVKRYLHQNTQARHRRLRIRTYAVIPFNEECGLVEWLPNLNSFRSICNSFYRARGLGIEDRLLRGYAIPNTEALEKKRQVFVDKLLPAHPPVFHEWFRQRFHTPHTWYEARSSYVKTIAVMSMVGYILGLGDRHGENVLFDETNGDAVHVDFNCLFNQGELFAYPELVPFRLTHNMVAAMGPLGVEGMFRKCCEITLRLLKQETKTLMSVLRPFVYDLVVQCNRAHVSTQKSGAELTDPKATADVRRIAERLEGYVKKSQVNSMPLSTEGQVSFLIAEATNIDNLAAMYIGWASYI